MLGAYFLGVLTLPALFLAWLGVGMFCFWLEERRAARTPTTTKEGA